MQNELITEASKLFPTIDHWQSFLELINNRDAIREFWYTEATTRIRRHFIETLDPAWGCEPFGATHRDTRWFLKEFGPDSLALSFSHWYRFDLKIWNQQNFTPKPVTDALKTSAFSPIVLAFGRIDVQSDWGSELIEIRNFRFESSGSRQLSEFDLAWFAAHQTASFVSQAIDKVEKFTNSSEVSETLRQLNLAAKGEAQSLKG